jgi:hypothetical protein
MTKKINKISDFVKKHEALIKLIMSLIIALVRRK